MSTVGRLSNGTADRARTADGPRRGFALSPQRSYLKTIVVAAVVGALAILVAHRMAFAHSAVVRALVEALGWSLGLGLELVAVSGLLVIAREYGDARGRRDLFLLANEARSERALLARAGGSRVSLGQLARRVFGPGWPVVGEDVVIRPREEIERTLDAEGRLDGLPFMPEMARFCGHRARVFRWVDKIYDYGGDKSLRRVDDVVLLAGLRCDGSAHGGCQASCYILWKRAWLHPAAISAHARPVAAPPVAASAPSPSPGRDRFICQFTELVGASHSMARADIRQDLRPLLAGNVGFGAFCVAMLTRVFNAAQRARRGVSYPALPARAAAPVKAPGQPLVPGATVSVRSREEIYATLDARGRNRGLWFDRDMMKHCGRRYRILRRVDRLIDDATGRMLPMRHPCLVLDEVDSSGEFLRFSAQHEYPFWREEWLSLEMPLATEVRP